jgi:hypothetical protein
MKGWLWRLCGKRRGREESITEGKVGAEIRIDIALKDITSKPNTMFIQNNMAGFLGT